MKASDFPGQVPGIVERNVTARGAEGYVNALRGALAILDQGNTAAAKYLLRGFVRPEAPGWVRTCEELQVLVARIADAAGLCDFGDERRTDYAHGRADVDLPAYSATNPADWSQATQFIWPAQQVLVAIATKPEALQALASSTGATRAAAIATLGELYWCAGRTPRP